MSESLKALGLRRHELELQANKERKEFSAHFLTGCGKSRKYVMGRLSLPME